MVEEKKENITISLPPSLVEKIKKQMKKAGFDSISTYVTFVFEELTSTSKEDEEDLTEEEEEKVKKRLRSLGYLD